MRRLSDDDRADRRLEEGTLLGEDVDLCVRIAGERYDAVLAFKP